MAQTQFRSDDTVKWWLKFCNASDGDYSSAGNATETQIDSACSGTAASDSLTATNPSFVNGRPIFIHQTQGTGAGNWEFNQILSYSTGTITTVSPLKNTYGTGAQVIQFKQWRNFTQNAGHTLTGKAWNGTVGGIIINAIKGTFTRNGIITANGCGFRGGANRGWTGTNDTPNSQGEGDIGAGTYAYVANGTGGGGGTNYAGASTGAAGGGNGTAGGDGEHKNGNYGLSGGTSGLANGTNLTFGGGGGAGGATDDGSTAGAGGNGGGLVIFLFNQMTGSAAITADGNAGVTSTGGSSDGGSGGGGAGGSILLKGVIAPLGTTITANGGAGGSDPGYGGYGGAGGAGRIHLDYSSSYSGSTTPTLDYTLDPTITDNQSNLFFSQL